MVVNVSTILGFPFDNTEPFFPNDCPSSIANAGFDCKKIKVDNNWYVYWDGKYVDYCSASLYNNYGQGDCYSDDICYSWQTDVYGGWGCYDGWYCEYFGKDNPCQNGCEKFKDEYDQESCIEPDGLTTCSNYSTCCSTAPVKTTQCDTFCTNRPLASCYGYLNCLADPTDATACVSAGACTDYSTCCPTAPTQTLLCDSFCAGKTSTACVDYNNCLEDPTNTTACEGAKDRGYIMHISTLSLTTLLSVLVFLLLGL